MKKLSIFFFIFSSLLSLSCKITKSINDGKEKDQILYQLKNDSIFQNSFTGFVLYDVKNAETRLQFNGDKFFTPASNTKIFTFYTAICTLGDSLPILAYYAKGDTLYFKGMGNPLFANPDYSNDYSEVFTFLSNYDQLIFSNNNFQDEKYGSGWAWDDYIYDYQLEKTALPLYGNKMEITYFADTMLVRPEFLRENIKFVQDSFHLGKDIAENHFELGLFPEGNSIIVPLNADNEFVFKNLSYLSGQKINFIDCDFSSDIWHHIYEAINDSIYIKLLHNSDNFIAEQLISMCSAITFHDTINSALIIDWTKKNLMPYLDGECRWVDGSGLSRYNLFKPESIVETLKNIRDKIGDERIRHYFSEIQVSEVKDNENNFGIYAKSGSLSNNYNLSGYIYTKKGNIYIFSFMNNHFLVKTSDIKHEMWKILNYIVDYE